jgi:hypothetical protein
MALDNLIDSLVTTAFNIAGDLRVSVDYHQVTVNSYDPVTDTNSTTEVVTSGILAVLVGRRDSENDFIDGDVNAQKLLMPASALPTNFVPNSEDFLMIGGDKWEIMRSKRVPGDSLHTLFIRLP